MNRGEFIKLGAILVPAVRATHTSAPAEQPEIAFTFDDPKTDDCGGMLWREVNARMLAALSKHHIKAVLFVTGKRVDSEAGRSLVAEWDQSGHAIGNHSYSHQFFNDADITLPNFESDVFKNEPLIRGYSHFVRLFRFPYFREGETPEKRDGIRSFLQQRQYRIGRATIDASDWAISWRLEKQQHIWDRAQFYDSLARRVFNHPVRHTVVLHHNALNALYLDQLIGMFIDRGWKPIDALYAYADIVYDHQPKILPAGESLVWAIAKESGKFNDELRYPGEDDVYENPKMDALGLWLKT